MARIVVEQVLRKRVTFGGVRSLGLHSGELFDLLGVRLCKEKVSEEPRLVADSR